MYYCIFYCVVMLFDGSDGTVPQNSDASSAKIFRKGTQQEYILEPCRVAVIDRLKHLLLRRWDIFAVVIFTRPTLLCTSVVFVIA